MAKVWLVSGAWGTGRPAQTMEVGALSYSRGPGLSRAGAGGARRRGCSCGQRPRGGTFSPRLRRALPGGCGPAGAALPRLLRGPAGPGGERPGASGAWPWGEESHWGEEQASRLFQQNTPDPVPYPPGWPWPRAAETSPVPGEKQKLRHPAPELRAETGDGTKSVGKPPLCHRSDEGGHGSTARGRRDGDEGPAPRGRPH